MLFNSIDFAIFFTVVFAIYWMVRSENYKAQNVIIIISSYIFYGWWDWRFLSLIILSTFVDFFVGQLLADQNCINKRKLLLFTSIIVNIGLLGVFKYCNFFIESFIDAFSFFGFEIAYKSLNIILPVGISFYTFQTLSYTIDIYYKKHNPSKDIIAFSAFVCFFPQLVAGPIERARNLLPQFEVSREFNYKKSIDGCRQILWGLFKKIVIADNCALYVDNIFANYTSFSGSTLLLGAVLFSFQIYCDFSGYSDIAIGTARLLGFKLRRNFAFPYFSRDIAEFWRRWHISLSSWFRDYLYIPLGGSRCSKLLKVRNVFIVFIVSGFWHGANWTFVIWGVVNALYLLPSVLMNRNRINIGPVASGKTMPGIMEIIQISLTFLLISIAWVFFRSHSIHDAISYLQNTFSKTLFNLSLSDLDKISYGYDIAYLLIILVVFVIIEWLQREKKHAMDISKRNVPILFRWIMYYLLIFLIIHLGLSDKTFIYFQF